MTEQELIEAMAWAMTWDIGNTSKSKQAAAALAAIHAAGIALVPMNALVIVCNAARTAEGDTDERGDAMDACRKALEHQRA